MKKYILSIVFISTIIFPAISLADYNGVGSTGLTLFPTATGNIPTLTGDSFSTTEDIISGIFGIFIVVLGLQLSFYFINSIVDLMTLRKGGKVKKISRLTAFMDRNSSAARGARRRWADDV